MSTPTLWKRSPKAWMNAALTARLPCCLCCWPEPDDGAARAPCEWPWPWLWPWPWEWRWPPWFNKKPILNKWEKRRGSNCGQALSTSWKTDSRVELLNSKFNAVLLKDDKIIKEIFTYIRLTATPTAAVMSITSPSMSNSWCTVLCTAS